MSALTTDNSLREDILRAAATVRSMHPDGVVTRLRMAKALGCSDVREMERTMGWVSRFVDQVLDLAPPGWETASSIAGRYPVAPVTVIRLCDSIISGYLASRPEATAGDYSGLFMHPRKGSVEKHYSPKVVSESVRQIELFISGTSVKALSRELGLAPGSVTRRFRPFSEDDAHAPALNGGDSRIGSTLTEAIRLDMEQIGLVGRPPDGWKTARAWVKESPIGRLSNTFMDKALRLICRDKSGEVSGMYDYFREKGGIRVFCCYSPELAGMAFKLISDMRAERARINREGLVSLTALAGRIGTKTSTLRRAIPEESLISIPINLESYGTFLTAADAEAVASQWPRRPGSGTAQA